MKTVVTVMTVAALCICAWAADNTVVGARPTANHQTPIARHQSLDAIAIPRLLNYQGLLTDTVGSPVRDSTYSVGFSLYTEPSGGSPFWSETQNVQTRSGFFTVLLGKVTPVGPMPDAGTVYLGMQVGVSELTPRLRLVSVAYAYKADSSAYAAAALPTGSAGGDLAGTYPNPTIDQMGASSGQVLKWTGSAWAPANDSVGQGGGTGDNAWARVGADSVLYTVHRLGIARGEADNLLHGNSRHTHINFGVGCTTGAAGQNFFYSTVGGGQGNIAAASYATVAGGRSCQAGSPYSGVLSGQQNTAGTGWSDTAAAVCGGRENTAQAPAAAIGGGMRNTVSGEYSTIAGGLENTVDGYYAAVGGGYHNYVYGEYGTVGGGYRNEANNDKATVGGGNNNAAAGSYSTVGGGNGNVADGNHATIGGGWGNVGGGGYSAVCGGYANTTYGAYSSIGGGKDDTVRALYGGVLSGRGNLAGDLAGADTGAVVCGGVENQALASHAAIGGGYGNRADARFAVVAGGRADTADGYCAAIGGGERNYATGTSATVGGGQDNDALARYTTVSGGQDNDADSTGATVGGGRFNRARGTGSVVGGGQNNDALDTCATVGGGRNNCADSTGATVGGGEQNTAGCPYSTVAGGQDNCASGPFAIVAGGVADTASGNSATVGGGCLNRATNSSATVCGGERNFATGSLAAIVGGQSNSATGRGTAVVGGEINEATTSFAFVGGGRRNLASGSYACVPGGDADTASGDYSFAANSNSDAAHSNSAAFNGEATTASNQTRVGILSKASGTFTIDHPLDPQAKILNHYFIEGPEMRNIYDGEAVLDASGRAEVRLPDYFDDLNRKPRVQLTGVGTREVVYVAEDVIANRFTIGGPAGAKVYWQVTGERKDVSAEATRRMMPVEQPKIGKLAGTMLDDDFLVGCMDQLVREGKAQGIDFRTAAGRAKYERMRQATRER